MGRGRATAGRRWGIVLLVVLLLLPGTPETLTRLYAERVARVRALAALAPGRNTLPASTARHQAAPPSPSGAYPPYPLNHTFDADVVTLPGSPTNDDFETAGYDVGTPPTNHDLETTPTAAGTPTNGDFASGDFTGWTTGGSPTIQTSGGPDGAWAQLGSGAAVTSAAFTVGSDAQAFVFDVRWLSTSGWDAVVVYALTGPTYGTSTQIAYVQCSGCNAWDVVSLDATAYRGQSLKLKLARGSGTVGVDRLRAEVSFPGLTPSGGFARLVEGGNAYARLTGSLTSAAVMVDAATQFGTVRLSGLTTGSDQATVSVLSGTNYATSTTALSVSSVTDGWHTYRFSLKNWRGQSIKVKVSRAAGTIGVDDLGLQRVDVPGWDVPSGAVLVDDGQGGSGLKIDGTLTSSAFTLPADVQQLAFRYRASDASQTGIYPSLLRGPTFATVTALSGGPLSGPAGVWQTFKANVTAYAGETVKLKFSPQLQPVYVDDAGILEQAVPGWTLSMTYGAVAPGSDGDGTYVTSFASGGTIELTSSPIDPGIVDVANWVDGRSYTVRYAMGSSGSGTFFAYYDEPGPTGQSWTLTQDGTAGTGARWGRFTLWDWMAPGKRLRVKVTNGGKVYSIADNVARQQLAEPFSQQAGVGIDTSTGNVGTSETDLTVQGGPLPLVFTRYYHGHSDRFGELGYRWSHSFDTALGIYGSDVAVIFGSGKEETFHSSNGVYSPLDVRVKSTLTNYTNPPDGVDYRYVTKDKLTYNFEGDGDLISIVDPNGNAITLYRDPVMELVTSIVDPGGRSLDLAYDGNGRLTSVTGPDGAVVTYSYDANGDLVAVDKPEDGRTEYAYLKHRLTQIKQRQGEDLASSAMVTVLTNTLDDVNRVIEQTDAAGKTTQIADPTGSDQGITRLTDPLGQDTDFYFDAWARTTHVVAPTGDVTQFVYDTVGNLQKWIDGNGGQYQFAYSTDADPTTVTDAVGNPTTISGYTTQHLPTETILDPGTAPHLNLTTTFTYDSRGNRTQQVVDPGGSGHLNLTTTWTYDATTGFLLSTTVDPTGLDLVTTYENDTAGNRVKQTVDPGDSPHLNLVTAWTYDGAGRVATATVDPGASPHLNQTTTYTYDLAGRLAERENARGESLLFGYDIAGNLTILRDELGHEATFTYDANNRPTSRTDAAGKVWTTTYDDAGNVVAETDPLGRVTATTYDAAGRVATKTVDAGASPHLNLTTSYGYDDAGRLASVTDPLDRTTAYAYDANGRLVGRTDPNGGVWTYDYDAAGRLTSVTDPLTHATTYTYDAANRLTSETDPTGHVTTYAYDAANRRTAVGRVLDGTTTLTTGYAYDAAGRLLSVTDPLGHATQYTYTAAGSVAHVTDPLGKITWFEYDDLDRLVEITDPDANVTSYAFDAAGRRTSVTQPSGRVTAYAYDARDLLTSVVEDPGSSPHLNLTTSDAYDDAGQRLSETNPRGRTTSYAYDGAGRQIEVEDALGGTVVYGYDAAGQLTTLTNARGKATTFAHDDLGNVATETDPLGNAWAYDYDLAGRQTQQTDANGTVLAYTYDAADRPTAITGPGGTPSYVSYGYDALGRQTGMTDATGTTSWTYDDASRVTAIASPQGTTAYTYDDANRRATLTLPGDKTIAYGYDDAGRLTAVEDWQSRVTTLGYDADGHLDAVVRPNGVETAYDYDGAGGLSVVETALGATLLQRFAYGLDENGNRIGVTVTGSAVTNGSESDGYDDLDRLTEATYAGGGTADYAYDADGNRLSVTSGGTTTSYTYDDADRLTQVGGTALTYDADGNRVTAGGDSYAYDWNDRLIEATAGGTTVDYAYAGDGLRASATVGGTTTPYLWDKESGLAELLDDGALSYVQTGQGLLAEVDTADAATYPLPDALGTVRARTDGTGAVVGTAEYDAFGNLRASSGTQGAIGWTGELRDATTGLTYLRSRDYAPGVGRFLTRDTVSPSGPGTQGYNPYAYAANNPVTLSDPSGHAAADAGGDLAQIVLYLVFLARIAAQEIGAGIGRALRWAGWALAAVAAVLFCLQFAPCRENASSAGGKAQDAVGTAVGAAAGAAQSAEAATEAFWEAVREHLSKTKTATKPEPEEEPRPEPTRFPPPGPTKSDEESCREAGQQWVPGNARYGHIKADHSGPPGTKNKGYFFRKAFENGNAVLNGYIQTVLTTPAFVAFQPGGTLEGDCYFEGPPGGFGQTIGKDKSHRTESSTLGIGLVMATRWVVSAYPCNEPWSGGRPVPGSCSDRPGSVNLNILAP